MRCYWCGRKINSYSASDGLFGGLTGKVFCSQKCKAQYLESKRAKETNEGSSSCLATIVRWIIIILVIIIAIAIMKSL